MALLGTSGSLALSQLVCSLPSSLCPATKKNKDKNSIKFCKFPFQGPFLLSCLVCSMPSGQQLFSKGAAACVVRGQSHAQTSVALSLNNMCRNLVAACHGNETTTADWCNCIVHKGSVY